MAESPFRFSFGVRAWTEMKLWCYKGLYMLKVISKENIQCSSQYDVTKGALYIWINQVLEKATH